jgi:hypothetical protein
MTYVIDVTQRPIPRPVRGGHFLTQERKPWLVNGIIREGSTVFLSGREGTGKSFVALELAYCIAEKKPFYGNNVSQGDVLYVAAERGDAQRERLEALRELKGYDPDSVSFLDYTFMFNVKADVELFHQSVKELGVTPKLIIIDTLRASFEGDENNSWNAQATMDAFKDIKRVYGATILVIHHVNAFGKSRGSSAFIGAADTELYLTESKAKDRQRVYLTVRKQNNGRKWTKFTLDAEEKDFGDDYTSIVFHLTGTTHVDVSPVEEEETNEREQNVLDILDAAGGPLTSLRQLQDALHKKEGSMPNRDTLKKDLERMAEKSMIVYEAIDRKFVIALPEQVEQ